MKNSRGNVLFSQSKSLLGREEGESNLHSTDESDGHLMERERAVTQMNTLTLINKLNLLNKITGVSRLGLLNCV